jgi:hypothetical protein
MRSAPADPECLAGYRNKQAARRIRPTSEPGPGGEAPAAHLMWDLATHQELRNASRAWKPPAQRMAPKTPLTSRRVLISKSRENGASAEFSPVPRHRLERPVTVPDFSRRRPPRGPPSSRVSPSRSTPGASMRRPGGMCAQLSCSPRKRRRARHRREDRQLGMRDMRLRFAHWYRPTRWRPLYRSVPGSRAGRSGRAPAPSRTLCALVAAGAAVASARETIRVAYRRSHR